MKENMRKEIKIGVILFAIFNVLNFIAIEIGTEIIPLHFCLGGLAALAFAEIIIGLLPESIYLKVKNCKNTMGVRSAT